VDGLGRERTTGQEPGRRHAIEQWALGSTGADLRHSIVIEEGASKRRLRQNLGAKDRANAVLTAMRQGLLR
jgi:hypothetical protein